MALYPVQPFRNSYAAGSLGFSFSIGVPVLTFTASLRKYFGGSASIRPFQLTYKSGNHGEGQSRSSVAFQQSRKGNPAAAARPSSSHDRSQQRCRRPKASPAALPGSPFPPGVRAINTISGTPVPPSSLSF